MTVRKKKPEHHWIGETPEPDKFFGFCYQITNMVTGQMYIGKKQYYAAAGRRKYRPSDITSDKWKAEHWKESNWKNYSGSSKELNADIKKHKKFNFTFEILSQHISKAELHYAEIDYQVSNDVLRKKLEDGTPMYYNKNIAGVKFIPPSYHSEATVLKLKRILKERGHPLQGKTHPNKGKSLPQCAPNKHVSVDSIQITDGKTNLWWQKDKELPEGFHRGVTKSGYKNSDAANNARRINNQKNTEAAKKKYKENPNICNWCNLTIPYENRNWKSCSLHCRSMWRSKCSKEAAARRTHDTAT